MVNCKGPGEFVAGQVGSVRSLEEVYISCARLLRVEVPGQVFQRLSRLRKVYLYVEEGTDPSDTALSWHCVRP